MKSHGTYSAYTSGCRCVDCRRANRDYQRTRRATVRGASAYDRWQTSTYAEAQRVLRERHRDEFELILCEIRDDNEATA